MNLHVVVYSTRLRKQPYTEKHETKLVLAISEAAAKHEVQVLCMRDTEYQFYKHISTSIRNAIIVPT
jgi:hypothetical protein